MIRYLVQPRNRVFVKVYGFLYFAKNMGNNISEQISKNVRGKYSQKRHDHAKQSQKRQVIWLVIKLLTELRGFQKFTRE